MRFLSSPYKFLKFWKNLQNWWILHQNCKHIENRTAEMRKCFTSRIFECGAVQKRRSPEVQKCANLVDLVKSFQKSIYLQNVASIQPRTGLSKFAEISQQLERKKARRNVEPRLHGGNLDLHVQRGVLRFLSFSQACHVLPRTGGTRRRIHHFSNLNGLVGWACVAGAPNGRS